MFNFMMSCNLLISKINCWVQQRYIHQIQHQPVTWRGFVKVWLQETLRLSNSLTSKAIAVSGFTHSGWSWGFYHKLLNEVGGDKETLKAAAFDWFASLLQVGDAFKKPKALNELWLIASGPDDTNVSQVTNYLALDGLLSTLQQSIICIGGK